MYDIIETWHLEDFYGLLQQLNASKMNLIERIY